VRRLLELNGCNDMSTVLSGRDAVDAGGGLDEVQDRSSLRRGPGSSARIDDFLGRVEVKQICVLLDR
jgi:hypothetical protein